jgi:hypothetical protein
MGIRLMLQPFWIRALWYGIPFGIVFGLYNGVQQHSRVVGVVISMLITGVGFGLAMAYQGRAVHTAMTEAVAGLDGSRRAEAIAAVTAGGAPGDATVRSSAMRLGVAYLGGKSDAQLNRGERQTWLFLVLLAAGTAYLVTISTSRYEATSYVALALLCAVVLPLGVLRTRRVRRNVAHLGEGAVSW